VSVLVTSGRFRGQHQPPLPPFFRRGAEVASLFPWTYGTSAKRDAAAAERFLRKTLHATHTQTPRVVNVDKNATYPPAVDDLKANKQLSGTTELRQVKYFNNQVELSALKHLRD